MVPMEADRDQPQISLNMIGKQGGIINEKIKMNHMKKILNSVIVLAVVAACMIPVGCQKENKVVTLNAQIDNSGSSKVYINNVTPCWVNGDGIFINTSGSYTISSASSNTAVIQNVSESSPYRAVYPASIVTSTSTDISSSSSVSVTLPRTQYYTETTDGNQVVPVPMGAYLTSGTMLQFHNICSLVKVNITNGLSDNSEFTLSGIEMVAASATLSGAGTATVEESSSTIEMDTWSETSTTTAKAVTLSFIDTSNAEIVSGASTIANGSTKSFYIICPPFSTAQTVTFQLLVGNQYFAKFELGNKSLSANSIANVNLTVTSLQLLSDLFTVNSSGSQVQFSKGNLQWSYTGGGSSATTHSTATTSTTGYNSGTFRFAEHQYDVIGANAGNTSDETARTSTSNSSWIDLFNYGTSGYDDKYPYSLSEYENSNIAGTNYDWGVFNAILNGTNTDAAGTWRTPTSNEWAYVITSRAVGSTNKTSTINGVANVSYAKATVNGVCGLLLFPDVFVWPPQVDHYPLFNVNSADFSSTVYTLTEWQALEEMNVIFLPATGHRKSESTTVEFVVNRGLYWSSSYRSSSSGSKAGHGGNSSSSKAVALIFQFKDPDSNHQGNTSGSDSGSNAQAGEPGDCNMGRAVRLVKDASSTSSAK